MGVGGWGGSMVADGVVVWWEWLVWQCCGKWVLCLM